MTQTVETIQTPSDDECGIVATFSEHSLNSLTEIQDRLSDYLGDAIWLTPRRALHSTLMEILCDIKYPVSRHELFAKWYAQYGQSVSEILSEIPTFEISFSEIEVSERAIIIRSATSDSFNSIRAQLLSKIDLPEGTKLPPDIVHCTLARYSRSLDLENVIATAQHLQCNFTEYITAFKLLKDLGPPSFEPKTIQEYNLRA